MREYSLCMAVAFVPAACALAGAQAAPQAVAVGPPWQCHIIDGASRGADGVKLADVNGDGFMDITTGWEEGGLTKVYLNPGPTKAKAQWPSVTTGRTRSVEDAVFVDLDQDGAVDVVSCCEGSEQSVFVHWAPKDRADYLDESKWRSDVIPVSKGMTRWMFCIPMQVDEQAGVDLVAGSKEPNARIGWFEVPEDARNVAAYKWYTMSPAHWIMSLRSEDMDGDGDLDILVSDRKKGPMRGCRWLENPGVERVHRVEGVSPSNRGQACPERSRGNARDTGTRSTQDWPNHFIGCRDKEVMFLTADDIDEDGLQDVLVAAKTSNGSQIFILHRLGANGRSWKEYSIPYPENTGTAKAVVVGDINLDGNKDIIFSCEGAAAPKSGVMWLSRSRGVFDGDWVAHDISGPKGIKYDRMELLDIDADGDLDILCCEEREGGGGLGLFWYENPHALPGR